jgi:hypothetical protein
MRVESPRSSHVEKQSNSRIEGTRVQTFVYTWSYTSCMMMHHTRGFTICMKSRRIAEIRVYVFLYIICDTSLKRLYDLHQVMQKCRNS